MQKISISKLTKNQNRRVILFIFLIFTTICFYYGDTYCNVRQGMNFWEALFSGQFFDYYSVNIESKQEGLMEVEANYDMFINFLMGLIQLPLYIVEKIKGGNIENYFIARVWGKVWLVVIAWICGDGIKKIAREIGVSEDTAEDAFFMFMSSGLLISSVCMVGQVDIISLAFAIYALLFLIKGEHWKFILFMTMAVQCKYFAFFIFVPILLLIEKNILKLMRDVGIPLAVMYLVNLPFSIADPIGVAAKRPRLWFMIDCMSRVRVNMMGVDIPILILTFVFVCVVAYYLPKPEQENRYKWYFYAGICGILPLLICQLSFPQWIIYILPMTTLLFFMNKNQENILRRLFLECVGTLSLLVGYLVNFFHAYSFGDMDGMLIDILIPMRETPSFGVTELSKYITNARFFNDWTASYAVFIVWMIVLLINNYPDRKGKSVEIKEKKDIRTLLWLRMAAGFILCNISIILYLIQR